MSDLVSIIIPTYNRAHLITETLDSIKAQTYDNWECIIVDDGSTDGTQGVLKDYIKNDNRFVYKKRPEYLPKGANACRNYGLKISKGVFINWFDSDDVMLPHKLKMQVKILSNHLSSPFCISQTQWKNKITNEDFGLRSRNLDSVNRLEDYILYKSYWSILAPLWRRNFLDKNGLQFDESLQQSQEYDFHINALNMSVDYVITDEVLSIMYQHDTNLSVDVYSNDLKIESNLKVKSKITYSHVVNFTKKGKLKWSEILTLYYKELLLHNKYRFAKQIIPLIFKSIKNLEISAVRKLIFKLKIVLTYVSFVVFGKGYTLVKPITY